MAYSDDHATIMRKVLSRTKGISERKMFGGLCFMLNGNMLCGIHHDGGMARIGKENESMALEMDGVAPLSFTGRKMGGMVEMDIATLEDTERLKAVVRIAKEYVRKLPAK